MAQKEWTIFIYMAGDNNLAVDMAYAMEQIKGVADESIDSPNLFVYYDGNSPSIPTLYCDFSDPQNPKYVRSFKVPDKLLPVPEKMNENAADKRSVINFVDWCLNKIEVENDGEISYGRRANRYAMIFSGHSLGFQDIGLFRDETSGRSMKMSDLYFMLQRLVSTRDELEHDVKGLGFPPDEKARETTVLLGQKIDMLGFDSCVMGMLEVGYQFNYVAKTMIASEGSVPSAGWTYAKILGSLARENKDLPSEKVVERFVTEFVKSQDSYTVGGVSVDMAAWDLCCLTDLTNAFDALSGSLIDCFADETSRIYRQMARVILQVHWQCQSYMYDQNIDLGDFCELLDKECGLVANELGTGDDLAILANVQKNCRDVVTKLEAAVILSGFSGGEYQYSNGMSVFFPWSREGYEVSRKNYESLWFAKDATNRKLYWSAFLKKYLNEVALRKFEPPTADTGAHKYKYFSGISFDERTSEAGISGATASKMAGHEGSKMAGHEGSKMAGHEGSKMAGHEGSKMAGHEGSKMADGGSSYAFFDNLKLFKNIESRWNISGFTKKPETER
ncbi:MAG: clostripain-related cysteine peptidase [Acidobacteriota bacterium]